MLCLPGIDAALVFSHAVQAHDPIVLDAVTRDEIPDGRRVELLVIELDLDGNQGILQSQVKVELLPVLLSAISST